jgi:hypothetical protein
LTRIVVQRGCQRGRTKRKTPKAISAPRRRRAARRVGEHAEPEHERGDHDDGRLVPMASRERGA